MGAGILVCLSFTCLHSFLCLWTLSILFLRLPALQCVPLGKHCSLTTLHLLRRDEGGADGDGVGKQLVPMRMPQDVVFNEARPAVTFPPDFVFSLTS